MEISQIFLSDDKDAQLSPFLEMATGSVKAAFPEANHTIYTNETLRQFIVDNYDSAVVRAYDSLIPYSYKADLGRFCLLNTLGGWYFDIAVRVVNPVDLGERIEFLAFRDIQRFSYTTWACATTVLYSKPDNIALETAIDMIINNCEEQYYGILSLIHI